MCAAAGGVWKGANKSDKAKDENHENRTTKKVRGSSNISSTAGITKTTYPLDFPKRFSNPTLNNNNNNTLFTFQSFSSQKKKKHTHKPEVEETFKFKSFLFQIEDLSIKTSITGIKKMLSPSSWLPVLLLRVRARPLSISRGGLREKVH